MPTFTNFFENLKEAQRRLLDTIILYDKDPFHVHGIADHKSDGIFRIYMSPIVPVPGVSIRPNVGSALAAVSMPMSHMELPTGTTIVGAYFDQFMVDNPTYGMIRKSMNSSYFNKFRPFPLGMCNVGKRAYFTARQPQRKSEQGLVRSAVTEIPVALEGGRETNARMDRLAVNLYSQQFADTIRGVYPSAQDCITNLSSPDILNHSVAYDRDFAIVRGPVGLLFLGYKEDTVGFLPSGDLSEVKLGRRFKHLKEIIETSAVFGNVTCQK